MSLATEKDKILTKLKNEGLLDLYDLDYMLGDQKDFHDQFYAHRIELEHFKYINCVETQDNLNDAFHVSITNLGLVFINNGGYTAIEQKELREEQRKDSEWRWRRGYESLTLLVAIGALILSVVVFFSTPKESQINKLQDQIDSLKKRESQLRKVRSTSLVKPAKNGLIK